MIKMTGTENNLQFQDDLLITNVSDHLLEIVGILDHFEGSRLTLNMENVHRIDSAGVAFLDEVSARAAQKDISIQFQNANPAIQEAMETFSLKEKPVYSPPVKELLLEKIGGNAHRFWHNLSDSLYLVTDTVYYAIVGLVDRRGMRKGEFVNQSILIGMNAFPIVALVAFLIGFILALQSAAQLRQFGASIYVADLIAISMTREMGPIMTAIVFAGRSGSSIASEIATMVVTEETDTLKSMALNPVRYVLVPKFYAITVTMPLLTILSTLIGIIGAWVIGFSYLGIGADAFYNEIVNALVFKDIITGLVKSIVFAWIIVLVGAYYGFHVKGGSEGVGKATTASVVTSIFLVILADSILGLIFYFGQPI
jgi:phospholipid/cholesterol/gamma-HCH transport system permease protein